MIPPLNWPHRWIQNTVPKTDLYSMSPMLHRKIELLFENQSNKISQENIILDNYNIQQISLIWFNKIVLRFDENNTTSLRTYSKLIFCTCQTPPTCILSIRWACYTFPSFSLDQNDLTLEQCNLDPILGTNLIKRKSSFTFSQCRSSWGLNITSSWHTWANYNFALTALTHADTVHL